MISRVIEDITDKTFSRFDELEQYIENLTYKVNSDYYRNTFDYKIAQLEKEMAKKEKENKSQN